MLSIKLLRVFLIVLFLASGCFGFYDKANRWKASPELVESLTKQRPGIIYDEKKVPDYTLPDALICSDGTWVIDNKTWLTKRRPEILELFRNYMYGISPMPPDNLSYNIFEQDKKALGGLATRKQIAINVTGRKGGPVMYMLVYLPNTVEIPVPVFIILNFGGNHTIHRDPAIDLSRIWVRQSIRGFVPRLATNMSRGSASSRFPLEDILNRGYGLATIYYGDIDPDFHDNFKNGVHGSLDKITGNERAPNAWGSIGAWAWGLSRSMDYFEKDGDIDDKRVVVLGHSRLGKTALWAGAQDERFALVISNNSGCGGAAISRRRFGESVEQINKVFPHWFCENFKKYNRKENDLPIDQHMLIALIAPRPVYVASADRDLWADPHGEFLSCKHAGAVYRLFGISGLGVDEMPVLNQPVRRGMIGYHIRSGGHDLTEYDWQRFMNFADLHLKKEILN
jgi:hypothetical protein